MNIQYLGHSCFLLVTEAGARFLTDPYRDVGYPLPRVRAEYVVCSHAHFDHNYTQGVDGVREVIGKTGVYERAGVKITGIPSFHDEVQGAKRGSNVIFRFETDGASVCHMGDICEPPSKRLLEQIGKPDVLMIPVGGTYTLDAAGALAYIRAIEPRVAVPMHYRPEDGSLDIAPLEPFVQQAGAEKCIACESLDTAQIGKYVGKILLIRRRSGGR